MIDSVINDPSFGYKDLIEKYRGGLYENTVARRLREGSSVEKIIAYATGNVSKHQARMRLKRGDVSSIEKALILLYYPELV
ncbi:MAG: hypothetical protein QXJ06_04750 [Candidatus Aenigmatarchaeota archaeon]